jgi:hypothetical protein
MMERNTVTTADKLLTGDVFYRQSDKSKTKLRVYQHKDGPLTKDRRIICVEADLPESYCNKPHLQYWLKPTDHIVFLRRPNPEQNTAAITDRIR